MLKKSMLVVTMVLLAGAAGQVWAGLVLDDGGAHTVDYAVDGNLEVYDGSTPPLPDITTVDLVAGGSVGNHLAVGGNSEVDISGGSVGHTAGVLNNLDKFTGEPVFFSTDPIPTVRDDIESHLVAPGPDFWDFAELPNLYGNEIFEKRVRNAIRGNNVSFIYQRYSLNNRKHSK